MSDQQVQQINDLPKPFLLGVGHPLLDISLDVPCEFLKEYSLKANDAILANDNHENLVQRLFENHSPNLRLLAGGSTLNSIRFAQWVFKACAKGAKAAFLGSVGEDYYARLLKEQTERDQVLPILVNCEKDALKEDKENTQQSNNKDNTSKVTLSSKQTGVCVALNTKSGTCRSLIAFLGAARALNADHVSQHLHHIQNAHLLYSSGFLLGTSEDAINLILKQRKPDQLFAFNLSAPYVCSKFGDAVWKLLPHLDILFCNGEEIAAFAEYNKWKENTPIAIASKILEKLKNTEKNARDLEIVVTQDKDPILVMSPSLSPLGMNYSVPYLCSTQLVDTLGAGDAFVGGFLAAKALLKPLEKCIQTGIYCARNVITVSGCQLPGSFDESKMAELFCKTNNCESISPSLKSVDL